MHPSKQKLIPQTRNPIIVVLLIFYSSSVVECNCSAGCDLALASYYIWRGCSLSFISGVFNIPIRTILVYNPKIINPDLINAGDRINAPFACECIDGQFLGHEFLLSAKRNATYRKVATKYFSNLTTVDSLLRINRYEVNFVANSSGYPFNVSVNCSCGDKSVSIDYGLFLTYPLQPWEDLASVSRASGLPLHLLQRYNNRTSTPLANDLVFIPGKGISRAIIIGISMSALLLLIFALSLYVVWFRKRRPQVMASFISGSGESRSMVHETSPDVSSMVINKAIRYSYKELARATENFSIAYQIGKGGFGAVFYAELRGQKAAIKKMELQASKEFLAELNILTHVHHLNLVRLLGYCIDRSLILVYEFIENGNLNQQLHGSGPLSWFTRLQIAVDTARGLEYIHEHTSPTYIHRDIKPANILIDNNFHAKIADFGLGKLFEVAGASLNTRVVGTFGYMPPEYSQYGDVSPKMDVYAFGVVLYELISAKDAVVKMDDIVSGTTGLISLLEDVFSNAEGLRALGGLVDPRIGSCYLESVHKVALLARDCTRCDPGLRPSMRSVLVALMSIMSCDFSSK